jgi:hypothetical protein
MKTDALTNPIVRAAIEALQNGNRKTWSALFEPDAELYDDGSPCSLKEFTRDALGHERFTSIDRVENNGLDPEFLYQFTRESLHHGVWL